MGLQKTALKKIGRISEKYENLILKHYTIANINPLFK